MLHEHGVAVAGQEEATTNMCSAAVTPKHRAVCCDRVCVYVLALGGCCTAEGVGGIANS